MNIFILEKLALEQAIERSETSPEFLARAHHKIELLDILSTFSDEDLYYIFDSGVYNAVFGGYVKEILEILAESDDEKIKNATRVLSDHISALACGRGVLSMISAKTAEYRYRH